MSRRSINRERAAEMARQREEEVQQARVVTKPAKVMYKKRRKAVKE